MTDNLTSRLYIQNRFYVLPHTIDMKWKRHYKLPCYFKSDLYRSYTLLFCDFIHLPKIQVVKDRTFHLLNDKLLLTFYVLNILTTWINLNDSVDIRHSDIKQLLKYL